MNKLYFKQTCVCLGLGALALTACVDNDYDVSNLDATVQIGQPDTKFSLPTSSTSGIELKNLFSIDDGSALQEINGTYYLDKGDKIDPSTINVDLIKISEPTNPSFSASLDLTTLASGVKGFKKAPAAPPSGYQYDISELAYAEITGAKATGISSDLVSIDSVGMDPSTFTLSIIIGGTNKDLIKQMHFSDLVLHLPKGLVITSCTFKGHQVLPTDDLKKKAFEEGLIEISAILSNDDGAMDYAIKDNDNPLELSLTIEGAKIIDDADVTKKTAVQFDKIQHSAEMTGNFKLAGYASLSNTDFDQTEIVSRATTAFQTKYAGDLSALTTAIGKLEGGDYSEALSLLLPKLDFIGTGYFGGQLTDDPIVLSSFTGVVQHAIDEIKPIELNDLPDFLQDDENTPENEKVTLNLSNPQIFLKLDITSNNDKPFNQKITTGVQMEAYQDVKGQVSEGQPKQQVKTADFNTGPLTFQGKNDLQYTILKRIYSNPEKRTDVSEFPKDYDALKNAVEHEEVAGLGTFLTKVPNTVKVMGMNGSNGITVDVECKELKLPLDVKIDFEYKVFTSLSFSNGFQVVYKDKEDGMSQDFKDLEEMNFGGLEITAKFYSDLPLPVNLKVVAYDIDGNEIKDGLKLPSVDIPANAKGVPRTLTIAPVAPHTFNDFIKGVNGVKKLDGIEYKVVLGGDGIEQGKSLKPSQTIRLDDVQISLLGGLKIMDNGKK